MLFVNLHGTKRDLKWFKKILERDTRIEVINMTEPELKDNQKEPKRFYRMKVDVRKHIK